MPPVSILKPLHGIEPQLARNLQSFFEQDYPAFEVLFAVDHPDDEALPIARAVCAKYPHIQSEILVTGEPPWPNPPAYSFYKMSEIASFDIFVTSDSDVVVGRDYLHSVVPPLLDSKVGMVTCLYRGLNTGGFWSSMDAIGMSVEMSAGVLIANLMEGIKFGLGPTIVVRKGAVRAIGGYQALGDYFSNDFMIGNLIAAKGYAVRLSHYVISHVVPAMTFKKMWQRQLRWATGTKHSRPKGHLGTGLVFAIPFGLIGSGAAVLAHHPLMATAFLSWSILNRMLESVIIGFYIAGDPNCLARPWLFLIRDLFGFCVWLASYLSRNMKWRDGRFELISGGKILVRERDEKSASTH